MTTQESGNTRGQVEVMRTVQTGNGEIETSETFTDARWRKDDDGCLWIIGADGPVATFAHGSWAGVKVKSAVAAE